MQEVGERVEILPKKDQNLSISNLRDQIKKSRTIEKCGAITSFTGIVRGITKEGEKVKKLHYECEEKIALKRLKKIRRSVLDKYDDVHEIIIKHVIDDLRPGEDILYIVVASGHRKQGFKSAQEIVEKIKRQVPIWKKEIRDTGTKWI